MGAVDQFFLDFLHQILEQLKVYFGERVSEYLWILKKWSLHKILDKPNPNPSLYSPKFYLLNLLNYQTNAVYKLEEH